MATYYETACPRQAKVTRAKNGWIVEYGDDLYICKDLKAVTKVLKQLEQEE